VRRSTGLSGMGRPVEARRALCSEGGRNSSDVAALGRGSVQRFMCELLRFSVELTAAMYPPRREIY